MAKQKSSPSGELVRGVIYARYSSSGQREESIEGQLRDCRAYAMRYGITIVGEYVDRAMTGTSDKRPGFQRMIRDSARGAFSVVLIWKTDRFARSRYDSAMYKHKLKQNGVRVICACENIPDTPEGIVLESVMEGFAEYYSANLSQNVKRGNYDSALKRQTLGQHVLGLRTGADKRFEIDPQTAPVVKRIFTEYAAGRRALDICTDLNAEGFRTALGRPFNKNSLRYILKNEKYIGVYEFGEIRDEKGIPAIIDRDLFGRVQLMMKQHHRAPASSLRDGGFLLTTKLFCADCGEPMTGDGGTSHTGKVYSYYICNGRRRGTCEHPRVPKEDVEEAVVAELVRVVHSDEIIEAFADRFMIWQDEQHEGDEADGLRQRLRQVEGAIKNTMRVIDSGVITDSLTAHLQELEAERVDLARGIAKAELENPRLTRDDVVWFLSQFREGSITDPAWRAQLVETFLRAAYLSATGRLLLHLNFTGEQSKTSSELVKRATDEGEEIGFSFAQSGAPFSAKLEPVPTTIYFYLGAFVIASRIK